MTPYKEFNDIKSFSETLDSGTSFADVRKNICMRIFNKNNIPNCTDESKIPHSKWADLMITFALEKKMYINDELGRGYCLITNDMVNDWGISVEELRSTAKQNMDMLNGPRIESITKHLSRTHVLHPVIKMPKQIGMAITVKPSMHKIHSIFQSRQYGELPLPNSIPDFLSGMQGSEKQDSSDDILMVSNRTMSFASINMFIGTTMEDIYHKFMEDYYIIPMSVHEVMCVKQSHALRDSNTVNEAEEDLSDMLEQINDKIISNEQDILSYNIYKYMNDEKCVMVVNR